MWLILATIVLLISLIVGAGRLITPHLNNYLPDFNRWVSDTLKTPVSIGKVYLSWDMVEPTITFNEVKLLDKETHKAVFRIQHVKINLNIFRSLLARSFFIDSITIAGVHVSVHQTHGGQWNVEGLTGLQGADDSTGSLLKARDILLGLSATPYLVLDDINILFYPAEGSSLSFSLSNLTLKNSLASHSLRGKAVLLQDIPTRLAFNINWNGSLLDIPHISAQTYVYLEGVNLPQWVGRQVWHDLQIKQGLGSLKIWANWDHNDWQKVQCLLQFYDLQVKSQITNKTIVIPRFNGHLGWRQEGKKQIFAGEQIFLDLADHLWPVTSFYLALLPDKTGKYFPAEVGAGYFDLATINTIAATLHLLPENVQTQLQAFHPVGEVSHFKFSDLLVEPKQFLLKAEFKGLGIAAVKKYPGFSNLKGALSWNGKEANISLASWKTVLILKDIFPNDLQLGNVTGMATIKPAANDSWLVTFDDLTITNADLKTKINMDLSVPSTHIPEINLKASFAMENVAHLVNYFPSNKMEPDLIKWLHSAFVSGQVQSGSVVLQGNLANFPFDKGEGKFLISGNPKNVDFQFAPGWPLITKGNGELVFSGRTLKIKLKSGYILNVPLADIYAEIPYLGETQPQILNVNGDIHADLADLLNFLHQSPLEKNIGNQLANMGLKGAANLKLNLVVPLKKPELTNVQGNLIIPDGIIFMPIWKISLEHVQGLLQFTEADILAKNLQGKLFTENATLNIGTQHPVNGIAYVEANLASQIDLANIQALSNLPIASIAQGKTAFTTQLKLYSAQVSSQVSTVTLRSDLQGITLNLPKPYSKTATETKNLQLDIRLSSPLLGINVNYDNSVTAAFDFAKKVGGLQFYSGEVTLDGQAKSQKEPGLLLTGNFKQLDWETINQSLANKNTPAFDMSFLRGVNLNVENFKLFGQTLNAAHIQLVKQKNLWSVQVNSRELMGNLTVSTENVHPFIQGNFQRCYLKSADGKTALDPKLIPALSIVSNDTRFNGKSLGFLKLNVVPDKSQLIIRELKIESPLMRLQAQGGWQIKNNSSQLHGTITTTRLSNLLKAWEVGSSNFVGNKGDIDFDLTWPSTPYQPVVRGMSGTIKIAIGPGRILDMGESNNAKMDLGRLLNLFSISAIPRRLALDFSDVVGKGYGFDYIKGDFVLKNGNAFTDNARSDGPIARVEISGRIGMAVQDFDLVVGVTPYVTGSLSTVVAFWNPLAGAATWLISQAVGKAMSKSTLYHYTVKGPWNNPAWQATH